MYKYLPRVTIFAVWVDKYDDPGFKRLHGPHNDVENLKKLLVDDDATALFRSEQFIEISNPSSTELRSRINKYIYERSAEGDILIFYFSGHGVAIGRDDFGFCTSDTIIHSLFKVTLPLSVVRFSEILSSINIANVIPVFIIDACYSGTANRQFDIPPVDMIVGMHNQVHSVSASSYILFCSCSDNQTTLDSFNGGVFSRALIDAASQGLPNNEPTLTFVSIYQALSERVYQIAFDNTPRLYIGATVPEFPLVINTKFIFRRYSLTPSFICVLNVLWNNGDEQILSPTDIGNLCGNGAYCNHNKLSFSPWQLVETIPNTKLRRLTDRGREFIQGNIQLPKILKQNPRTGEIVPTDNTPLVSYSDFIENN
jgi:hypothetical protein